MKLFNLFKKKQNNLFDNNVNFDYKKLHSNVFNNNVNYECFFTKPVKFNSNEWEFAIYMRFNDNSLKSIPIKVFLTDDFDYGVLCAEELCEHLSQSI